MTRGRVSRFSKAVSGGTLRRRSSSRMVTVMFHIAPILYYYLFIPLGAITRNFDENKREIYADGRFLQSGFVLYSTFICFIRYNISGIFNLSTGRELKKKKIIFVTYERYWFNWGNVVVSIQSKSNKRSPLCPYSHYSHRF